MVTDPALYQWIDLGVLSEACIILPDTCGPVGAAVSVWVKIHSCPNGDGLMSSMEYSSSGRTGFLFFCNGASIRYVIADCKFLKYLASFSDIIWSELFLKD